MPLRSVNWPGHSGVSLTGLPCLCSQQHHQLAELNKKQLEDGVRQLQEQLQLIMYQQNQVMAPSHLPSSPPPPPSTEQGLPTTKSTPPSATTQLSDSIAY